ncbi:hypothetical protein L207DRAFT_547725 [Hyaloscypha variabilis F]|uniref:Uncharacterized protein n=1 Tax=Hyaloscypha variabilis (strain UAMH 11265 / GT02V1 / F) TaxID=1149755 RepID=A0A2J6R597_HYAVF|nr:hypothetical protein L207DRAFT_547725 [Hyaloscypha variabilis F]
MRVPPKAPLVAKSGNANMPSYDKSTGSTRPLMPVLSASAKASSRAPLTPRVAGTAPSLAQTPLSRRGARSENNTPSASSREDLSTPVSAFLNNNITPRSSSRKSRVDSANTTPTGTPNGTPVQASNDSFRVNHDPPVYGSGLGINGIDKDIPKRPTVSFSPAVSDIGYSKSPAQNNKDDSKFFFASEAKAVQPARPPLQSKTSTSFVYANGETIGPPPSSSGSAVGSTVDDRAPKFFHANGTPDLDSVPHFPPPRPSSVVSSSSRINSPRLTSTFSPPIRPNSPSKLQQQASVSSLRNTPTLDSPVLPRPQPVGRGQSANGIVASRKASIESGRASHGRSASVGSQNDTKAPPVRKISGGEAPGSPLNLITTSVPISTPEEIPEPGTTTADSALQSPIKTGHSIEQLNELAANARRERKVLDLEITNSSLAAINRTLEREMRKQTAELRRYRRLSRSGRLSIATSASMRNSEIFNIRSEDGTPLSNMSEDEEEEDSEEEDSFSTDSEEGSLSPRAMAESDARHRQRDEKRLQLDLTKHQQLLIDSQKMNQSLKRCLGWTEELINEGKKALEYHVRVSDVELGGRVLAPDEVEGEGEDAINEEESEGLSMFGARLLREARKAAKEGVGKMAGWGGEGKDDRDSGIEVDGSASGSGSGAAFDSSPTSPR